MALDREKYVQFQLKGLHTLPVLNSQSVTVLSMNDRDLDYMKLMYEKWVAFMLEQVPGYYFDTMFEAMEKELGLEKGCLLQAARKHWRDIAYSDEGDECHN